MLILDSFSLQFWPSVSNTDFSWTWWCVQGMNVIYKVIAWFTLQILFFNKLPCRARFEYFCISGQKTIKLHYCPPPAELNLHGTYTLDCSVWNYANICIYGLKFPPSLHSFTGNMLKKWIHLIYCKFEVIRKKKKKLLLLRNDIQERKVKFGSNLFLCTTEKNRKQMCLFVNKNPLFALRVCGQQLGKMWCFRSLKIMMK